MRLNNGILYLISPLFILCVEKVRYISVEHPVVSYYNTKYVSYMNLTSNRYGRTNPVYYVGFNTELLVLWDNDVLFLSNVYKRSFVEIHYRWCDLLVKDKIFGPALRQGKFSQPCPHKPGIYHLVNMTIPPASIPRGFPFRKGRILCNITYVKAKELIAYGHIDMEIKEVKTSKNKTIYFSRD